MAKINFNALYSIEKRAVFWLADQADTLTTFITESISHPGEIMEAVAFLNEHYKGSKQHTILITRLRLGNNGVESILACIARAAPAYRSIAERPDNELDDLLKVINGVSGP